MADEGEEGYGRVEPPGSNVFRTFQRLWLSSMSTFIRKSGDETVDFESCSIYFHTQDCARLVDTVTRPESVVLSRRSFREARSCDIHVSLMGRGLFLAARK